MPKPKRDLRIIVHTESHSAFGSDLTLTVRASVCYIEDGEVLNPRFSYEPDGVGEYEGLCVSGQVSSYQGVVDAEDFYGRSLSFRDLYSVELPQAESNVKVLRRVTRHLERLDGKFGRTDFAGLCGRFADAVGATDERPLGIYDREQLFVNGTHYRWMDTDGLRIHLADRTADWMSGHNLARKDTA